FKSAMLNVIGREADTLIWVDQDDERNIVKYISPDVSNDTIIAQIVYVASNDSLRIAWNFSVAMKNSTDWWNIRINAKTGEFIEKNNYVVHESFSSAVTELAEVSTSSIT